MDGQKEEAAADMGNGGVEPEYGDVPEEQPSHDAAQDRGRFNRRDPDQRLRAVEARAEEQGTERQPLRDLVDTNRYDEREVQRSAAGGVGSLDFMARRQRRD